jgi:hypothetical protein
MKSQKIVSLFNQSEREEDVLKTKAKLRQTMLRRAMNVRRAKKAMG